MSGKTYRDLELWQKSMDLVVEVYKISKLFPRDEQFGLTSQIRRAITSVPSNIAEGQGRQSAAELIRFLYISRGSLTEAETQLLIALRLDYITRDLVKPVWGLMQEVGRLLNGLIRSFEQKPTSKGRISELSSLYETDSDYRLPTTDYWEPNDE